MNRVSLSLLLCVLAGLAASGCKDGQACELQRLELARVWEEVRNTAGRVKVPRDDLWQGASEGEKDQHRRTWEEFEKYSGLVQSSFSTTQVTWDAATLNREKLFTAMKAYTPKRVGVAYEGFTRLLESANKEYVEFKESCR